MRKAVLGMMIAAGLPGMAAAEDAWIRIEAKRGAAAEAAIAGWKTRFDDVQSFALPNGMTGIALGPLDAAAAAARMAQLKAEGTIPADSYLTAPGGTAPLAGVMAASGAAAAADNATSESAAPAPAGTHIQLQATPGRISAGEALAHWRETFPEASLWRLPGGMFAVALAAQDAQTAADRLAALKAEGKVPGDAYLAETAKLGAILDAGVAGTAAAAPATEANGADPSLSSGSTAAPAIAAAETGTPGETAPAAAPDAATTTGSAVAPAITAPAAATEGGTEAPPLDNPAAAITADGAAADPVEGESTNSPAGASDEGDSAPAPAGDEAAQATAGGSAGAEPVADDAAPLSAPTGTPAAPAAASTAGLTDPAVPEPAAPPAPAVMPPLEEVQSALHWAGFYDGPIDGKSGPGTRAAIEKEIEATAPGTPPAEAMVALIARREAWRREMGLEILTDEASGLQILAPTARLTFDRAERGLSIYGPKDGSGAALILTRRPGGQQEMLDFAGLVTALGWVPHPTRQAGKGTITLDGADDQHRGHAEARVAGDQVEGWVLIWPAEDAENARKLAIELGPTLAVVPADAADPPAAAPAN